MKTTLLSTAALMIVTSLNASPAQANEYDHMDRLAMEMRNQTARLAWDIRHHFRGSPEYRHLYSDVYEMFTTADHIHDLFHHGFNLDHLRADIEELDRLFHHVEELADQLRPSYGGWHGSHGHHFHGGPSRDDIRRLRRKLDEIGDVLHHLREDLDGIGINPLIGAPVGRPVPYQYKSSSRRVPIQFRVGQNGRVGVAIAFP